jgi:hypothetical protein
MGPLATIPRGGCGWGKRPARSSDRYHKGKTIQLLAAFAPHTGKAIGLPSPNKTGEAMLAFLQDMVVPHFGNERKIYLVWDNFSAHKLARRLWKNAQPTSGSAGPLQMSPGLISSSHGFSYWRKPRCTTPI